MLKKLLYIVLAVALLGAIAFFIVDKPLPTGTSGPKAEQLANKMLSAVGKDKWDQIAAVKWSYTRGEYHHYLWDKEKNLVRVEWDTNRVIISPDNRTGVVFINGVKAIADEASDQIKEKALSYFFNDSFWLEAQFKVKDPGTERFLVQTDSGNALMVKYNSGGVTPGDIYLWHLDDKGLPLSWQMWVKIIPVGGLSFTWDDWKTLGDGTKLSTSHNGLLNIEIENLEIAPKIENLNDGTDPFLNLDLR